jgi:RNA polymerase sigma factor (sigma-70 family)
VNPQLLEDVWRRESSHVLGALLRRHGDFGDCEDAAQEALAAAAQQWPRDGIPDNPRGWLVRVASRRLIDHARAARARVAREQAAAVAQPRDAEQAPPADADRAPGTDDTLQLFLLCCHPALSRPSQVALTLRAVAGLSTAQIASAFLVPEATMAQRVSRAKATLRSAGARFEAPAEPDVPGRVAAVLDVLHLVFNEGHTRSGGDTLLDRTLALEAIRLTRRLRLLLPDHDEVAGALALMLLTHARADARTDDRGDLVPMVEQDRARWDRTLITEGVALLEEVLPRGHVGRYQLQASIAAVHAEATSSEETDWLQISLIYEMLGKVAPSPAVLLNRAVAEGMSLGPTQGLALIEPLLADPAMRRHHRTYAVQSHLLEMAGRPDEAVSAYRRAAQLTGSQPEQRYLNRRAARVQRQGISPPGERRSVEQL